MRCARRLVVATLALASFVVPSRASADDDCPPGSNHRTEDGFSWCEPTVCSKEVPCKANEVCRPIALCMQVGTLADAGTSDAGKRLVVTQRCVAGEQPGDPKTCPQKQTCSEMNRCITKATAEKLGLLDVSPATSAPSASSGSSSDTKRSCGCDVVGRRQDAGGALTVCALMSLLAVRRRRRAADLR